MLVALNIDVGHELFLRSWHHLVADRLDWEEYLDQVIALDDFDRARVAAEELRPITFEEVLQLILDVVQVAR